jgi:putative tryptophan/tyrosine transport system substrate-binding protein
MNRRDLVAAAVLAIVARPIASIGQGRMPRIGFLGAESASGYAANVQALRAGLRDLGYIEGKNLAIEFRWADSAYARLQQLAEELVRAKVDVIVTHGAPGTGAAKRATQTVPIVMASAGDAVATGLVTNLARPEGNVTGSTFFAPEVGAKRLDLLKEAMPGLKRVGYLSVPGNPISRQANAAIERAARALDMELVSLIVQDKRELDAAVASVAKQRAGALVVPEYSLFRASAAPLAELAVTHRLPAIGFREFAAAGGMMGYGPDDGALYRRAAVFVDKLLKGAKPGELPVERAATFELIVNRATAKRLGMLLAPAFLLRADRVIE